MIKVPDTVAALIQKNPFLQTGLQNDLLNLTKVSTFLHPLVEARSKKTVQPSAILMALSRLRKAQQKKRAVVEPTQAISTVSAQSGLAIVSFDLRQNIHADVAKLYREVRRKRGYITVTEGQREVTIIIEEKNLALLGELIPVAPLQLRRGLGCLGVTLDEQRVNNPGLFHFVFQQLYFQGINVIEIASTTTELMIYIEQADMQVAFATLYGYGEQSE
ncbi:MAG: hypothetical protein U0136_09360 [Bdellovibrionota bacterium]